MKIKFIEGGLERGKQANGETNAARTVEDVDSAADTLNGPGKVIGAALEKDRPLLRANELVSKFQQGLGRHRLASRTESAANPQGCRQSRLEVQVAGTGGSRVGDHGFQIHFVSLMFLGPKGKRTIMSSSAEAEYW